MATRDALVREVDPAPDSLVGRTLPRIDYRDALQIRLRKGRCADIDDFARRFFLSQPTWLRTMSMNTPSRAKIAHAVGTTRFQPGDNIGSWRVHDRNQEEIVFGESLGFMTYRFSLRLDRGPDDDAVEASTVAYLNGWLGRFYFAIVRLLHKPFVRHALLNTFRAASRSGSGE